jgi:hypothetical protein
MKLDENKIPKEFRIIKPIGDTQIIGHCSSFDDKDCENLSVNYGNDGLKTGHCNRYIIDCSKKENGMCTAQIGECDPEMRKNENEAALFMLCIMTFPFSLLFPFCLKERFKK